jgi:hypothetical protein
MRAARRNRTRENDDGSTSAIHSLMTECWDPQMMATRFSKRIASAGEVLLIPLGEKGWDRVVEFVGSGFSGVENSSWSANTLTDPSLCVLSFSALGHFWMVDDGFRRFRGDEDPCGIRSADWDLTFVGKDAKASGTERNIWLNRSV